MRFNLDRGDGNYQVVSTKALLPTLRAQPSLNARLTVRGVNHYARPERVEAQIASRITLPGPATDR